MIASCYVNLIENLTGKKVKRLRCDNGREFLNKDIYNFAKEKGFYIETNNRVIVAKHVDIIEENVKLLDLVIMMK